MLTVRHASFRRLVDEGGQTLAEVEVHPGESNEPQLLAYFRNGPQGYQLVRVVTDDAEMEVDWFDNNLHDAFQDVTALLFAGPNHLAVNDRNVFGVQILNVDEVREQLDRHLDPGGT